MKLLSADLKYRECFENAGEVRWRGRKDIGCYIGTWGEDWKELHTKDTQSAEDGYSVTGIMDFQFSNKISHEYDLQGPRYVFAVLRYTYLLCGFDFILNLTQLCGKVSLLIISHRPA